MNDFGAAWEGDGGNNTNGTIGIFGGGGGGNNGASQNGYWALYDMIDLVNGGNGSWDHFGRPYFLKAKALYLLFKLPIVFRSNFSLTYFFEKLFKHKFYLFFLNFSFNFHHQLWLKK